MSNFKQLSWRGINKMNNVALLDINTELAPFESKLAEFKKQYDGVVYDLDDETQNKQARSDRLSIGKVIADLDRKHKDIKAPLAEAVSLVDGARKRIKDDLLLVQGKIKGQIEAHEQKERDRINAIGERIQEIRALAESTEDLNSIGHEARLKQALAVTIDNFQEFKADAALAKTETIESLTKLYAERLQHEKEQAELAKLRAEKEARERAEREERIRREAQEKAQREAGQAAQAERDRVEREHLEAEQSAQRAIDKAHAAKVKAQLDAKAAAANAKRQAEEAAANERAKVLAEQLEAEQRQRDEQDKEDKRKAKQAHRAKIHKAAKASFIRSGVDTDTVTEIVELIKDGKIAHVEIVY